MTTITEVIPSLGDVPTTADPASFDSRADTLLGTALPAFRTSANTWATQANVVAGEVNDHRVSSAASAAAAALAETGAEAASATANYKGAWALLTGALNIPASVSHNGQIWILESNLADVTTDEPGVSAVWTAIDPVAFEARSSNTILGVLDRGKIIRYSAGSFTQTFDAAASLTENWFVTLVNDSTANITLDPYGAETIEQATLRPADIYTVYSDGSNLKVISQLKEGLTLISTATASGVAQVDFTDLSASYDEYELHMQNVVPVTDDVNLHLLTSADNGSSYDTGAGNYRYYGMSRGTAVDGSAGDTEIMLTGAVAVGSDTNETGVCGLLRLFRPAAAEYTNAIFSGGYIDSAGGPRNVNFHGYRLSAAAVNAIRIVFSSGNIESGYFKLYGVRSS